MLTLLVFVGFLVLFFVAREKFYRIVGALCFLCVVAIIGGIALVTVDAFFDDKPPAEKSAKVLAYEAHTKDLLERLNEHTWQCQLFFIKRGEHDLAEAVIAPKAILEAIDSHYMSINPERINRFIMADKAVWHKLPQLNSTKWQKLQSEHQELLNEFLTLKMQYPTVAQ